LRAFGADARGRKRARKHYEKAEAKGLGVVKTKGGRVRAHSGSAKVVTFLIGVAFGLGECDLGPLEAHGPLQIFKEDHEPDEEDDDDDDDDDNHREAWLIMKVQKDKGGISVEEIDHKKKAKRKFDKLEHRKRTGVLVHGGRVNEVSGDMKDDVKARQLVFIIGCAAGKGLVKHGGLGPLEDGGKLAIYEDEDW